MPEGQARVDALKSMSKDEKNGKRKGNLKKWYVLDSKAIFEMNHVVYVKVNPSQRKSKLADSFEAREDYVELMANPILDQEKVTREYLISKGKDPEKYIRKQQPQMPGEEGLPQGVQPMPQKPMKMPNAAQGAEKKMNNLDQINV
jgi:hypothetical protein